MSEAKKDDERQEELLARAVIDSLQGEDQPCLVLTFDRAFAERASRVGADVIVADPSKQWPEDTAVDLAYCSHLVERVDDDQEALEKVAGRLKDEGVAIVVVPVAKPALGPKAPARRQYALEELLAVILRAGLEVEQWLAEGPDLQVAQCRKSQEEGGDAVTGVARALKDQRFDDAERILSETKAQIRSVDLVREYALLVGHTHMARERLTGALEAFTEASKLGGPTARAFTAMGAVAVAANDISAASELFQAAREVCPTHVPALKGLGLALERSGKAAEALTYLDMASIQRPFDRDLADHVLRLSVALDRAEVALLAIDRHFGATGDKKWVRSKGLLVDQLKSKLHPTQQKYRAQRGNRETSAA